MEFGIGGVGAGANSVFNAPGIRPADQTQPQPFRPQQTEEQQRSGTTQAGPQAAGGQTLNTAPTEQEREAASASGRTRGSFVDIQA